MRQALEQCHLELNKQQEMVGVLQQKMHKKILKREAKIDEMREDHSKQLRKLQKELQNI